MNKSNWSNPWPQWKTHWHVLHAWPALAQSLVLSFLGLFLGALGGVYWCQEAVQTWWNADEELLQLQAQWQQLQVQESKLQTIQAQLNALPHPSGQLHPAWHNLPAPSWPLLQPMLLAWSKQHGLQIQTLTEDGGSWRAPLPQLLSAWQAWAEVLPQHRILAFELHRLDSLQASGAFAKTPSQPLLQLDWHWTTALEKEALLKPVASASSMATTPRLVSTEPQVLHNPFSAEGLKKSQPPMAHLWADTKPRQVHGLHEMQWVGFMAKAGQPQALLHYGGMVHAHQVGQNLGQDWGQVIQIAPDHLLIKEWRVNDLGQWQAHITRLPDTGAP